MYDIVNDIEKEGLYEGVRVNDAVNDGEKDGENDGLKLPCNARPYWSVA